MSARATAIDTGAFGTSSLGPKRLVVIADRVGDGGVFAVVERVVAAHHALKFGEFADDAGRQVGFAETRGAFCFRDIGADLRGDLAGQRFDALHPLILRAELGVEDDLLQIVDAAFQRAFAVLVPEELGIGQPRRAARARCRRRFPCRRRSPPCWTTTAKRLASAVFAGLAQREIFLMRAHGGPQDFRRQVHERVFDPADQHDGPFGEPRHFVEQAFVFDEFEPQRKRLLLDVVKDDLLALRRIQDHMRVAQLLLVILEAADLDLALATGSDGP